MADEENTEEEVKPKRSIVKTILFILAGPILLGGGFAAGMFYAADGASPSEEVLKLIEQADPANAETDENADTDVDGNPIKKKKDVPEEAKFETTYYEFPDPITTNLLGSSQYLQIGLALATQYDEQVTTNVEKHQIALQSDMLSLLSAYSIDDVSTKDGRDRLALELKDAINQRLENLEGFGGVEHVYFKTFVLQ